MAPFFEGKTVKKSQIESEIEKSCLVAKSGELSIVEPPGVPQAHRQYLWRYLEKHRGTDLCRKGRLPNISKRVDPTPSDDERTVLPNIPARYRHHCKLHCQLNNTPCMQACMEGYFVPFRRNRLVNTNKNCLRLFSPDRCDVGPAEYRLRKLVFRLPIRSDKLPILNTSNDTKDTHKIRNAISSSCSSNDNGAADQISSQKTEDIANCDEYQHSNTTSSQVDELPDVIQNTLTNHSSSSSPSPLHLDDTLFRVTEHKNDIKKSVARFSDGRLPSLSREMMRDTDTDKKDSMNNDKGFDGRGFLPVIDVGSYSLFENTKFRDKR